MSHRLRAILITVLVLGSIVFVCRKLIPRDPTVTETHTGPSLRMSATKRYPSVATFPVRPKTSEKVPAQWEVDLLRAPFSADPVLAKLDEDTLRKLQAIIDREEVALGEFERSIAEISAEPSGRIRIYIPPFEEEGARLKERLLAEMSDEVGPQISQAFAQHELFINGHFDNLGRQDSVIEIESEDKGFQVSRGFQVTTRQEDYSVPIRTSSEVVHVATPEAIVPFIGHQAEAFLTDFPPAKASR